MMAYMAQSITDIDRMPRGGPNASCLDRLLQTDRLEYLDRDDVDDKVKRSVIRALEWTGEFFGNTEKFARIVLDEVADVPDPKILELGSGHGGLSRKLLEWHPTAELTVTDIETQSVAAIGPVSSASTRGRRSGRWTPPRSTHPTGISTWRCSRSLFITYRRRWRRACSPKAPAPPTSW